MIHIFFCGKININIQKGAENQFGITSIKQTCSDKYSYNRGELVGYNVEYEVHTYGYTSYLRPVLHVMLGYGGLCFTEADYDVDSEKKCKFKLFRKFICKKQR